MMTRALVLNGAHKVYIIGRRQDVLQKAAESVATGSVIPLVGDVTSKESLLSLVQTIEKDVGYINVLIANSGIIGPTAQTSKDMSLEEFQKEMWKTDFADYVNAFAVNTAGVWYTTIAFLGLLDKGNKKGNVKQQSQVIATSSIGGFNRAVPGGYSYGQTKAAVTHMTKQLATGLVPYGIRANVICPGRKRPYRPGGTGQALPSPILPQFKKKDN
jgi:NAD(P)-dependent dehydrogenase (short-subunit alcohol dehydrogenase family)